MSPTGRARWKQEKRGRALRARVQTRCLSLPAGALREELRDLQYLVCRTLPRARTAPTICWHVERTPLNLRAGAGGCMSSASSSRNELSRARESEERATDLSVCTPLCAPQEVARTLSASPPTTQRAGAREIRARTPRGTSGRAFLGGESPSPAARERGSGGPRRADLNQNHAVPRLSGWVRSIPYHSTQILTTILWVKLVIQKQ